MVYTFINPKVALMGPGSVKEIGKYALELGGTKALIVSGKSRHGQDLAEDIQKILSWRIESSNFLQEQIPIRLIPQ